MGKGDRLIIHTPGGGAWGPKDNTSGGSGVSETAEKIRWAARGSLAEREAVQAGF